MTDSIIAAGQRLLQRQTGAHGLQPPCLGQTCAFHIRSGDFIQVVNSGRDHWLTISTIGAVDGTVNVYDSILAHSQKARLQLSSTQIAKISL